MTGTEFAFLAGGIFAGALIVALFDAPRFWKMHEEIKTQKHTIVTLVETLKHTESLAYPNYLISEDGVITDLSMMDADDRKTVRRQMREKLYEKHEGLVKPGSEVLDLTHAEEEWAEPGEWGA